MIVVVLTFLFAFPTPAHAGCIGTAEPITQANAEMNSEVHQLFLNDPLFKEFSGNLGKNEKTVEVPVIFKTGELTDKQISALTNPHYDSANDAGLLLMFRAPSAFSLRDCGEKSVSVSESAANSMVNPNDLTNKTGNYRYSDVDAVGRTGEVKVENGNCKRSLSLGVRAYQLINPGDGAGHDLIAQAVSSKNIEAFHKMMGYQDPYNRRAYGLDNYQASLSDIDQRTFNVKEGQIFILPIRIKYDEYRKLIENPDSKITLDTGTQALIPVSKKFGQAAVGAFENVTATKQINDQWAATVGAGVGVNLQKTIYGGYQPSDSKSGMDVTSNAHIAGAITKTDVDKDKSTSFVVDVGTETPLLNKGPYRSHLTDPKINYNERLGEEANTSHETGISMSFVRTQGSNTLQIGCKEDYKNGSWKGNGNNNEDFKCSADYARRVD